MIQSRSVLKAIALVSGLVLLVWWLPNPGGEGVNLYRTHSVVERARSVVTGWEVFEDNPVWGVGFNAYRTVTRGEQASPLPDHPSGPDNSFVLVLATAGSVGFVAMVGYVTAVLVIARNNRIIWYSLWAILLHSLTNNTFFYAPVMWWWGMLLVEAELTSKLRD
jgi:hypothetical protein